MKISFNIIGITILVILLFVVFKFLSKDKEITEQKYINENVEKFNKKINEINEIIEKYSTAFDEIKQNFIDDPTSNDCLINDTVDFYHNALDNIKTELDNLTTDVNNKFNGTEYYNVRVPILTTIGVPLIKDSSGNVTQEASNIYLNIINLKEDISNIEENARTTGRLCKNKCTETGQKYVITEDTTGVYIGKCVCNNDDGYIYATNTDGTTYCKDWKNLYNTQINTLETSIQNISNSVIQTNPTLVSDVVTSSISSISTPTI